MAIDLLNIRAAQAEDASALAAAREESWRYAYQGLIPHLPLERMLARRGLSWWQRAIASRAPVLVLEFDGAPAGYATFGRSRLPGAGLDGEIYELYVRPAYQGVGFGTQLFHAAHRRLEAHGLSGLVVWALADNDAACAFYLNRGGKPFSEGQERFGEVALRKVAFGWR